MKHDVMAHVVWALLLIKHLETVALRLQPFDGAWQGIEQFVVALDGVVEGDDATRSGIAADVEQNIAAVEACGIVACDKVPHDDAVALLHCSILLPFHPSVWWAEEVCPEIDIGLVHVAHIAADAVSESADVVEGMVAQPVTSSFDHLKLLGVLADVVSHHKEGGFDAVVVEHVKHPRCDFGDGAIVEGEIDGSFVGVHAPEGMRIKPSEKLGGLFDNHGLEVAQAIAIPAQVDGGER